MFQETSQECILDIEYNNLANNTGKTGLSLMTPGLRLMHSFTYCIKRYWALLPSSVCLDNRVFTVNERVGSFSVSEYRL